MNTFDVLRDVVARVTCKPGWTFDFVDDDEGFRLTITVPGLDSRSEPPHRRFTVMHFFPIPTATYNAKSWRRWIFECCRKVEDHELGEWFLVDGERPFAPLHGPGNDPYTIREVSTEEEALTDQQGNRSTNELERTRIERDAALARVAELEEQLADLGAGE